MTRKDCLYRRCETAKTSRFYHFDQVYPLATIRYLRRLDYSLAQIKEFLHSNGLRDNLQMLSEQAEQMRRQSDELNAMIQIIQQKVEFIERETGVPVKIISVGPDREETIVR